MTTNFKQLETFLEKGGYSYGFMKVDTDNFDVDSHVKALGIKYSDGMSTILVKVKNADFVAILRRDDRSLDSKSLKKVLGTGDFRFCKPDEVTELGFESGLVAPILLRSNHTSSSKVKRIIADKELLDNAEVVCGSGDKHFALKIKLTDLKNILGDTEFVEITKPNPDRTDTNDLKNLRVLSGITPSSSKGLHLGNYLGAVKPHVEFQEKANCYYFIADYHALNTVFDKETFNSNIYQTYLDYLALGINLEKTVFFVESHVRSIFELTEILNNVVTLAHMKRMHAYKDKLDDPNFDPDQINMGLFNYPILMAADILVFEPDFVPVGEDQAQHVEICRDIAKSFNARYGDTFKVPELYIKPNVARVTGTDGVRKMSKSLGNDLTIFATEEQIKKQIMGITTDPGRIHATDKGDPSKNVIFRYMELMDYDRNKRLEFEDMYRNGKIADTKLKEEFFDFFLNYFSSYRTKRDELSRDRDAIINLMKENSIKANLIAEQTISKVRKSIGALII